MKRGVRGALRTFALAVVLLAALAAPAAAAPVLEANLTHEASEVQWVQIHASSGQFRLGFQGDTTPDLAYNATPAEVQTALNALPSIATGGGSVAVQSTPANGSIFDFVAFTGGPFRNTDVPLMSATGGTVPLGGVFQAGVSVEEGTPSGLNHRDKRITYALNVKNVSPSNPTFGPVSVELELFGGLGTAIGTVKEEGGWSCVKQAPSGAVPAKMTCTNSSAVVAPEASFTPIVVTVSPGSDAPDHAVATVRVSGGGAAPTEAADVFDFVPRSFGLHAFDVPVLDAARHEYTQAGGHPVTAGVTFSLNKARSPTEIEGIEGIERGSPGKYLPIDNLKGANVDSPRGFVGNALAPPVLCPSAADLTKCPEDSIVGVLNAETPIIEIQEPVYAIVPEFGAPAEFAYRDPLKNTYTVIPRLRADEGYALEFQNSTVAAAAELLRAEFTFCGFGGTKLPGGNGECLAPEDLKANETPLITNPTRCAGAPPTGAIEIASWQNPGEPKTYEDTAPPSTGCDAVPFTPEVSLEPTNHQADSPTGLDVEFKMPTEGLLKKNGVAQANLDNAVVTFPKGMSVNPASADGLTGCSLAQIKLEKNDPEECPESSRIGEVEVDTPLLRETLTGSIYLAKQNDNPFKTPFGIYMSFSSAKDGVRVKVAGKLVPDPVTGQLVSTFAENPEWPFSSLRLHFNEGQRAPLVNPPKCGSYAIHSELSPWSAVNPANPTPQEIVAHDSTYEVTSGPNGSSCPGGALGARMSSGLQKPEAGAKSPFNLTLSREDGSQRFTALDVTTPKGLTAYLKGIPYCPDSVLSGISTAEGAGSLELASPACPAASQVGTVTAGAGSGSFPFHTPGKVYLAGPYKGAPVSLAVVTPAVAGPFDLGNVVIRNALYINPETAQVTAKSDPIPTILHGILIDLRQIHLSLDRPGFTAAPTNCQPMAVSAHVSGAEGASVELSNRFQVGNCAALGFHPKLGLRLFGGTHRGAHPRLVAKLTYPPGPGFANIASASVALPHSEFLDQAHIRTVCTRVQFAAHQCPAGSVYGEAEAVTPLLDQPLTGPVYLRSSDNPLPDLVAALRGPDSQPIEVVLDGRIDSVHGGIRTSFDAVPDQPVSSFTLRMQGGKKGLLVNSRNTCRTVNKATANFAAQNGRSASLRPVLQGACKSSAKKQRRHKRKH